MSTQRETEKKTVQSNTIVFDEFGDGRYEGDKNDIGLDTVTAHRHRVPYTLEKLIKKVKKSTIKPNYWFYGPTGCGKTYAAYLISEALNDGTPYKKAMSQYWRQYHNEKVVLLDDVKPGDAVFFEKFLKTWGDNYPFKGKIDISEYDTKTINIDPSKYTMIIASNYPPEDIITLKDDDLNKFNRLFVPVKITSSFMRGYLKENSDDEYESNENELSAEKTEEIPERVIKNFKYNLTFRGKNDKRNEERDEEKESTLESSESTQPDDDNELANIFSESESDEETNDKKIRSEKRKSGIKNHEEEISAIEKRRDSKDSVIFVRDDPEVSLGDKDEREIEVDEEDSYEIDPETLQVKKKLKVYHEKKGERTIYEKSRRTMSSREERDLMIDAQVHENKKIDNENKDTLEEKLKKIQEQISELEKERSKLSTMKVESEGNEEKRKRRTTSDVLLEKKKKLLDSNERNEPPTSLLRTGK